MSQRTQTVIFSKAEGGWTVAKARRWLEDHGLVHGSVDETEHTWRFRQFDPTECTGSFRTLTRGFPEGVSFVTCDVADRSRHRAAGGRDSSRHG